MLNIAESADVISVCICTFQRPSLLGKLLNALEKQAVKSDFALEIVVVDNAHDRSAEKIVRDFERSVLIPVVYGHEPERNISLARNRAIRNATGNLVALIDDDECPAADWLVSMYRLLKDSGAAGILGPVLPDIPPTAPKWLSRGDFFDRPRHKSGTPISARDARTGNVLLWRSIFVNDNFWFDPAFGRTGGEDSEFFARQFATGNTYLWCDEAEVYESVSPERWTVRYHVRRRLTTGAVTGRKLRRCGAKATMIVAKNILILLVGCLCVAPVLALAPTHARVRMLQKMAYCGGVASAYFGWYVARERG